MNKCLDEGTLRAYLDGELPAGQMSGAGVHLNGCAGCRARQQSMLAGLNRVNAMLDSLEREDVALIHGAASRRYWAVRLAAAGLAGAALAASILLFLGAHRPTPIPARIEKPVAVAAREPVRPVAAPQPVARIRKPKAPRVEHPAAPELSLDDFVPVAGADPIQLGMVVRVMLPVSDASLAGGVRQVAADVVIGEDGIARAIKFLE